MLGKHYFSSRIQKKRPREGFVFEKKKDKKRRLQEDREEQKEFDQASHNKKNNSAIPAIMNDNSDKDTKNSNQMEIDNYPQILSPKLMHKKAKQQAFNYEWPIIGTFSLILNCLFVRSI